MKSLEKLINGNDIRGIALEGVEGEKVNLTDEIAKDFGFAFAKWLSDNKGKDIKDLKISVGKDSRITGDKLKNALIEGMVNCGVKVYDFDLASTPAMFMSTVLDGYKYDGAIMITASHLPFNRNGMKFFTCKGAIEKEDLKNIVKIAEEGAKESLKGEVSEVDFMSQYAKFLVDTIKNKVNNEKPLEGFKIIVDAGNGSGGFFASKVLEELGANTEGSQFLNPDGNFPNHIPNPENKEAIKSLSDAVLKNNADLGIIFDTDVDRAAVVDKEGNEINRNRLIALISAIILEEHPKSTVVTDSVTSEGLKEFIEKHCGGVHHRFKRGYKNVINESKRLNNEGIESYIAIETSGHAALKENYFLDDGAYLIAKILIKMAKLKDEKKDIKDLITALKEVEVSEEYRVKINEDNFKEYGNLVLEELNTLCKNKEGWEFEIPNYEGVRIKCDKDNGQGWFLVRLSLHDPVIVINIESNSKNNQKIILNNLVEFFSKFEKLNIDKLK